MTSASRELTLFLYLFVLRQSLECSSFDPRLNCEVAEAMKRKRHVCRANTDALLCPEQMRLQ